MRDLVFLGRFRIILILGVIAHHCPLAWTVGEWWPVNLEPKTASLNGFLAVNYACGMAFFFLISGYMHPRIVDMGGLRSFLKRRFLMLGVPMVFYLVAVVPWIMYAYYLNYRPYGYLPFWEYYVKIYWGINTRCPPDWTGPAWSDQQLLQMWFSEHLLIFGIFYALWRVGARRFLRPETVTVRSDVPLKPWHVHASLIGYSLGLGLIYYWVRIKHPLYHWTGLFDAIQVEYARLPQRASLFVVGMVAYRRNWLTRMPSSVARTWTWIAAILTILVYTRISEKLIPFTAGGAGWNAACYALLDACLGTSICVGLLTLFYRRYNTRLRRLGKKLVRNVYSVYIIHLPIVVALQYGLAHVPWHPILLSVVTALISIPLSFVISHYMVLRIPLVKQCL